MNASADLLNALTGSLVHFLWQGAAIAALAAALMFFFRSPTTRYLVGIGALALMLASFAITFCMLRGSPGNSVEMPLQLPAHVAANTWMPDYSAPLSHTAVASERDFLWVARTWLAGVLALALRIVFGLLVIEQLRRRNLIALPAPLVERFTVLQQRLGIRRFIRYCECQRVRVPAVIGFFRPVVLIPVRALTGLSVEQLEAVVAHELGHIKRFDVAVNFVQVIAETLFFFHPAVWWLNRRIRADREDCCDDVAVVMSGGRLGYARALAAMATWRDVPRFAMGATGSPLAARVARLLGAGESDAGGRTAGVLAALLVLVSALIAGVVSLGLVKPAQAAFAPSPPAAPRPPEASAPPAASAPPEASAPVAVEAPLASPVPVVEPAPVAPAKPVSPPSPPDKAIPAALAEPQSSYIDALESAGLHNLEIDQLIALRVQSVTPEYVRDMRGTGLNPNVHELVAMKEHGITPEYVQEVRSLGVEPDAQEIIAMQSQGISAGYVKSLRDLGIDADANEIIALKAQGVTPQYVREMRGAGFNPNTPELVAMKAHDVTTEYRQEFQAEGYEMTVSELIAAKAMDITPEFIEAARKHGFQNPDIHELIQLKVAGVF